MRPWPIPRLGQKAGRSVIDVIPADDGYVVDIQNCPFDAKKVNAALVGFGCYVLMKHDNGFYTVYAHLDSVAVVKDLTVVVLRNSGTVLGKMGNTGTAATHLHFNVYLDAKSKKPDTLLDLVTKSKNGVSIYSNSDDPNLTGVSVENRQMVDYLAGHLY